MKIIVIDEELPYPMDTGKRIRSFNLISRLAKKHSLTYLSYGEQNSEEFVAVKNYGMNPKTISKKIQKKSGIVFYLKLFFNIFSPLPYMVTSHYSKVFQKALLDEIEQINPEVILCEWSPYSVFLKKSMKAKKIIVAHNIEHRIWQRYFENETSPIKKWYIKIQLNKLITFEKETFSSVDGITVVSEMEKEYLTSFCRQDNIKVVDNGVDLGYFVPSLDQPIANNLVFVGSMNWRPNQDAVNYFVKDIFPSIKKLIPNLTINFVGKEPPKDILRYNEIEGIHVTGGVPDVRPYIQNASAYIVPLRIGGGTRLKILEALAMRKPIVSTSIGAEGLHVSHNENILLADSPQQFVESIQMILTNEQMRESMADKGQRLVEQQYSWDSIAHDLELFLKSINSNKSN